MTRKNKLSLSLATAFLSLALFISPAKAEDNGDCQIVYGGQVCGSSTPEIVDTAGEVELLYALSGVLYTTGLTSFVLAKKADKLVPLIG